MFSNFTFPDSPTINAHWKAVQLEPIIHSGERITVLIILKDNFGNISIHKAIDEKVIQRLFNSNSSSFIGLINYLEKSFSNLSQNTWKEPFDGVYISEWINAVDFSISGILKQALLQTSSFFNISEESNEIHHEKINHPSWNDEIENITTLKRTELTNFFNKKIQIAKNIEYQYDFAYKNYISNFIDFTKLEKNNFQKPVFNIQLLKDTQNYIRTKEIILHLPNDEYIKSISHSAQAKLSEKIDLLSITLKHNDISLFKAESAQKASDRILEMVA